MPRRKLTENEKFLKKLRKNKKDEEKTTSNSLEDTLRQRIPEPAYVLEVGDEVFYGAYDYSEILEVCEGGKYYKLYSEHTRHNTNKGCIFSHKVHYEPWYKIPPVKNEYPDKLEENEDIRFYYSQRELASLLDMMLRRWGIDLNPDYQRGNVWNVEQKVNLIDSIFKNVDIGKFTLIKRPWGNNPSQPETPFLWEMLDGKQRLTALYEFYIGRFSYKGHYYHELHPRDRSHFKRYAINYAETEPITNEQKYRYFLKLNTTGSPVSKEHLDKVKKMWEEEQYNEMINEVYYPEIEGIDT